MYIVQGFKTQKCHETIKIIWKTFLTTQYSVYYCKKHASQNSEPQNSEPQNTETQNLRTQNLRTQNLRTQNLRTQNLKISEIYST